MWELDYKESWVPKNWCFWTVVLEKILESPLDCKEIKPVNPKTLILWPPDVKNWLIWKDPDARKDWRQEEKGTTEDKMVGWHHWLNGHDFEQVLGVGDGQGSLACCSPWGLKESDMTEWLTELRVIYSWITGLFSNLVLSHFSVSVPEQWPFFYFFYFFVCVIKFY